MTKHTGIYIDLDGIIDTRLNLLYAIDNNLADKLVSEGKWSDRHVDKFDYISHRTFKYLYKKRNRSLLSPPRTTGMIDFLTELSMRIRHNNLSVNETGDVNLYLNTYPYDIDVMELDMLIHGISQALPSFVNVHIFHKDNITPEWISNNVLTVIMYDGLSWIEKNTANNTLTKKTLPEVMMVTPLAIYPKCTSDHVIPMEKEFSKLRETLLPLIRIEFSGMHIFSS